MQFPRGVFLIPAVAFLAACASGGERPDAQLARAEAGISQAEKAGAREYGAADLDMARAKLVRAQEAAEDGEMEDALRLAEQAEVDAEVAAAKGGSGKSMAALTELKDSLATLRQELDRQQQQQSTPLTRPLP